MAHSTYAVIEAKLANPIGSFDAKRDVPSPSADQTLVSSPSQTNTQRDATMTGRGDETQQPMSEASMMNVTQGGPDFSLMRLCDNPADAVF
jgi:hypothetical protein